MPDTEKSAQPPSESKASNPLDYLPALVSAIAAIGGLSIALGMLSNAILLIVGGATVFATALTIEDHISAAAANLPLIAVGIGIGMILRFLDRDPPEDYIPTAKEITKERSSHRRQLLLFCGIPFVGIFTAPIHGVPMALAFLALIVWGFMARSLTDRYFLGRRVFFRTFFAAGFCLIFTIGMAASDGLVARVSKSHSEVSLNGGKTEQGNVLFVGSRGTILTNRSGIPKFIAADQIMAIEINPQAGGIVPSIACMITKYFCYGH